ncbi:hypothetical protein CW731_11740 [Polaribacter sp. ALD11]|uniref:DUF3244 domain-containing protein n=1 Tax=Polaribacter sp. ALD11 TaxID=2058137 RepID=UPI000C30C294|nr:DUF3244 domain-containing protein [Polaribacter sp. ALD11]AUC86719.1 hypothetical protein CW731_11740 [Polaribacter sp. ALD11]
MKTIIKKYLVVVMMFGTLINYATENNTNLIKSKKVRVAFETVKKGQTISIKNKNGAIIYSQEIENSGTYSQIFDLSKIEEGNYTTELEKDYEIIIKTFTVLNREVTFKEEKTIFKPVIRIENNLILISKIDFDKEPLKVKLYYKNEVIHSETVVSSTSILKRVYRVSKELKGDYRVVIYSNNRYYAQDFNL